MTDTLSIKDAQKLVLLSQRLPPAKPVGSPLAATLSAIEHLGYIQIDTISAVQRAHHHTLWSRNPRYAASHLDRLVADKQVFEYWSHAAAYLPMRDYRFSLPRKHAIASGAQRHWYAPDAPLMQAVLKRIAAEGPLMAKDFEHTGGKLGEWKSKPAKRALEYLFMQGELMLPRRESFHKVYDLTERVLPEGIDTRLPTPEAHARFLITRYLQANGLGQAAEICYLQNNMKPRVSAMLNDMASCGEVVPVHVGQHRYYALPASLALLSKPLRRSRLSILSPFDNLLIQRKRMRALFDFDYLLECYVPAAKRQHGYFSLPILWGGALVARMDCKAERRASVLHVQHLVLEPGLSQIDDFAHAFSKALSSFMAFNACRSARLHRCTPERLSPAMAAAVMSCRA